jgi:hypothetical protein
MAFLFFFSQQANALCRRLFVLISRRFNKKVLEDSTKDYMFVAESIKNNIYV